jgi:hypothetical protein
VLRIGSWLAGLAVLVVACAAPAARIASSTTPAAPEEASAAAAAMTSPIVGVWRGEHKCEGIAGALADAGFSQSVIIETVVGNELLPGLPDDISDVTALCEDAAVLEHSHEFTADGQFFSYNQDGEEVDFGTYELVDDDTISIGAPDRKGVTFDFAIEGDQLTLEPQLEEGCLAFECQWAVMVAMPWSGMKRVE